MDDIPAGDDDSEIYVLTEEEFNQPFEDEYLESISKLSYEDLDDKYNPGPTLPDGSINFECHCVGHLVASPCGHEFREAMKCQKAHDKEDMEQGVCAEKFLRLIECFMRTECFKGKVNDDDKPPDDISPEIIEERELPDEETES